MRRPTEVYYKFKNTTIRIQYNNLQITLNIKHTSNDDPPFLPRLNVYNF